MVEVALDKPTGIDAPDVWQVDKFLDMTLGENDDDALRSLQVDRLVALRSSMAGQHLIGIIQKITRTLIEQQTDLEKNESGKNTS
jgi:hypothetical protein